MLATVSKVEEAREETKERAEQENLPCLLPSVDARANLTIEN